MSVLFIEWLARPERREGFFWFGLGDFDFDLDLLVLRANGLALVTFDEFLRSKLNCRLSGIGDLRRGYIMREFFNKSLNFSSFSSNSPVTGILGRANETFGDFAFG